VQTTENHLGSQRVRKLIPDLKLMRVPDRDAVAWPLSALNSACRSPERAHRPEATHLRWARLTVTGKFYLDQNHRTRPPLGTQQSRWTTSVANSAAGTRAARPGRTPSGRGWAEPVPGLIVGLQSLGCPRGDDSCCVRGHWDIHCKNVR
jgi:hypothetical protein